MTDELLTRYKREISGLTLVPSDGGRFELSLDGKLLFSKLKEERFPTHEEIVGLLEKEGVKTA